MIFDQGRDFVKLFYILFVRNTAVIIVKQIITLRNLFKLALGLLTSYSVIANRQGHKKCSKDIFEQRSCFETTNSQALNVSTHSNNAASSGTNIYILQSRSTRKQTVA